MKSADLRPGTRVRHKSGSIVTLSHRKKPSAYPHDLPFHPGWWLVDNRGGLADYAIDNENEDWTVLDD